MAIEVVMPKFGLTMHEGTIKRFFKQPGEAVTAEEPLFEVETEKVLNEVPSPGSGILASVLFEAEDTVECGTVIAVIAQPGEDLEQLKARYPSPSRPAGVQPAPAAAQSATASVAQSNGERRSITPIARKLAAELKVDLARVAGTGPGGRVTREDVERAAKDAAAPAATSAGRAAPAAAAKPGTTIPLRGMRKTIAERMHQSLQSAAQLTLSTEADVTAAVDLRAHLGREADFTYTDLMIHAVARALRRHPRLNARLIEGAIALIDEVNVGMAVALDEGLIVPVIRGADRKSLRQIAAETKELSEKARSNRLKLDDVSAGTFTITNLGTYGIDAFTPIINPGEAAILGLGRIIERPSVYRGEIARRSVMTLSLTFDHRLLDGAPAAAFLQTVIELFNYGDR